MTITRTIKNINGGIQRDNSSCGLFTLMNAKQNLKIENIGVLLTRIKSMNTERKHLKILRKIKYRYSIMYFHTFN